MLRPDGWTPATLTASAPSDPPPDTNKFRGGADRLHHRLIGPGTLTPPIIAHGWDESLEEWSELGTLPLGEPPPPSVVLPAAGAVRRSLEGSPGIVALHFQVGGIVAGSPTAAVMPVHVKESI